MFFITSCNTPELFNFTKEAFYKMALFINVTVIRTLLTTIALGRNHWDKSAPIQLFKYPVDVIGFVCDEIFGRQIRNNFNGWYAVMDLASCKFQTYGIAQGVDGGMNFCRQTTATAANRLGVAPPFPPAECWCARI